MSSALHNESDIQLVREFANTLDTEDGTDELSSPAGLTRWLRAHDLLSAADAATGSDLALARELRAGLRAELRTHHGADPDPEARRALDAVTARLPLRVAFAGDRRDAGDVGDAAGDGDHGDSNGAPGWRPVTPALAAAGTGVRAGLAAVLASVVALARSGDWERLKICPADDCQWAFFDESRNRSRRWCSMEVCGNRSKLRTFRDRHGR
jgi:predicted RNA-binding Zn ribbon-like protein